MSPFWRSPLPFLLAAVGIAVLALVLLDRRAAHAPIEPEVPPTAVQPRDALALSGVRPLAERTVEATLPGIPNGALGPSRPEPPTRGRLPAPGWQRFAPRVEIRAGMIEVLVLDGAAPASGVPVSITTGAGAARPERFEDVTDPRRARRTDAAGLARFEPLDAGQYGVQAWIEPQLVLECEYVVEPGQLGHRLVLRAGSGTVEGRVFDRDGSPCPEAWVALRAQVQDAHSFTRWTRTDGLGRYRFERQPEGFCSVNLHATAGGCTGPGGRARFVLEDGATHAVDLGSPHPPTTWSGSLRAADGSIVPLGTRLSFDEVERGTEVAARTDDAGSFHVELPRGTWAVRALELRMGAEIDRASVDALPLRRDLVVPGHVVLVRVSPPGAHGGSLVLAEWEDAGVGWPLHGVGDVRTAVLPAPARYRLSAYPPHAFLEIPREGSILDVNPGASVVRIDLTVRAGAAPAGG